MSTYTIYRKGLVVGHVTCPPSLLERNTPAGCVAVEGTVEMPMPHDWQDRVEKELARDAISNIERGQIRTIREALLGDESAIERLRQSEPALTAAREVLRRPRPTAAPSAPSAAEPAPPRQD